MFVFLLLACVTEESFPGQAASAGCSRAAECHKADFEQTYEDPSECVDDNEDVLDCYKDNCEFDPEGAVDWLSEVRQADCDDVDEAIADLSEAYDNCDEWELVACIF